MDESDIEIICFSDELEKIYQLLQDFLKNNETTLSFPGLSERNQRAVFWTALFQHLQNKNSKSIHAICLAAIRILSRDKTDLENLICEKWISVLVDLAGLQNYVELEEESMVSVELPVKEIAVEAMKCLCNIAFNSELARALCALNQTAEGLIARLRAYKDIPFKDDIMLFDMKLLFILTALRQDIKAKIKDELHGMDYLNSCLNEILLEVSMKNDSMSSNTACANGGHYCLLTDQKQAIVCEILKAQFNLIMQSDEPVTEAEEAMYLKVMPVLTSLLYAHCSTQEKLFELHSNIANLLTSVPLSFYQYLTPELIGAESASHTYDGRNMDALQSLVQLLQYRLTITTNTRNQYENLSPVLTVLNKCARGCRAQRKYLRQVVLPPLRDVSRPPEKGSTLRNQLCRLLTTPVTSVRDLVAEFIFILCKEKVGRMVKYTGFGNAAGHLAQNGLLAGGGGGGGDRYSSSSSDSDTEEYRSAHAHIDPVVGCTRAPRPDPFQGMTDEQKEYEAMKLVTLFDKMVSQGMVRPARVGADGRPEPVDHVLELRDRPPNRPQS